MGVEYIRDTLHILDGKAALVQCNARKIVWVCVALAEYKDLPVLLDIVIVGISQFDYERPKALAAAGNIRDFIFRQFRVKRLALYDERHMGLCGETIKSYREAPCLLIREANQIVTSFLIFVRTPVFLTRSHLTAGY